ncbi:MAG: cytochrome c biogenesis protein CcdA [bacterium]
MKLFEALSAGLNSMPLIALSAAFVWGILSIVLSPCHIASIPLIVGFISDRKDMTVKRSFILSLLFSTGILITIALIGLVTGLLGRMLGDIGRFGNIFVGAIFILVGSVLLEILPMPSFGSCGSQPKYNEKGYWAALVLGLVFGVALGPCTFAYMAPILAVVFNYSVSNFIFGMLLITAYAIGHCSVIVLAGTSTELVQKYLNWNERSHGSVALKKACGLLVILGGIYFIIGGIR